MRKTEGEKKEVCPVDALCLIIFVYYVWALLI